jgi:hypothetical protein
MLRRIIPLSILPLLKMFLKVFTLVSLALAACAAPAPSKTFGPVTIFSPPTDYIGKLILVVSG